MPVASNDDTWIQIIKERCFLLKASSSGQRRRAAETRGRWRGRFSLRATGINCFTPGVGRGTFTVVSGAHSEHFPPPKYKHYTQLTSSIQYKQRSFSDAFCGGGYWIEIHIFLIRYFFFSWFLELFSSGCCGPPLLNEYREDTSTFTVLKYLVGLRQHPPWTAVNRTTEYVLPQHHLFLLLLFFFLLQIHLKKMNFSARDGLF